MRLIHIDTTLLPLLLFAYLIFPLSGQEFTVVSTPPFAESVTEGDVKWEKGECYCCASFTLLETLFIVVLFVQLHSLIAITCIGLV